MIFNFYNNFNNGDVHFSRTLIEILHKNFPNEVFIYRHKNKKGILKDIKYVNEMDLNEFCNNTTSITKFGENIYINTWYSQENAKFSNIGGGCTLKTVKLIINNLLDYFKIKTELQNSEIYPKINFENLNLPKIKEGKKILICNGLAKSGQSNNMDFSDMINKLSNYYPNVLFYVTDKFSTTNSNIIFTSEITNLSPDLLEIAYISTKCDVIIGRASGPYSFSMIRENILNETKIFIAACNIFLEGIWDDGIPNCKYIHYPGDNINDLFEIIKKNI